MTDREHPEAEEAELVEALRRHARTTSARHDEVVLEAARSTADMRRNERRRGRSTRWRIAASLAATVIVALGLLWLVPSRNGPTVGEPVLRGERAAVSPSNGATLDAPPGAFEWPAQAGAAAYRVVLLDAAARPIWQSEPSPENRLVIPEDVARRLADGGTYLWRVEIRRDGRLREIGPFSFDVATNR